MSNGYYRPGGFGGFSYFPPVIKNLLIANAAVFFLQYFVFAAFQHADNLILKYFALQPLFTDNPLYPYSFYIWQFVTYQFLHGGFSHIFFNMFALWMFGMEIENTWGSKRFLIFYLLCGVGGAVAQLTIGYLLSGSPAPTIGASGAVYGVMIAFALMFPDRYIFIYFLLPIKAKYLVPGLVLLEFMAVNDPMSGVAHLVHLGGAVTGLIFMLSDKQVQFDLKSRFTRKSTYNSNTSYYGGYDDYKQNEEQYRRSNQPRNENIDDAVFRDVDNSRPQAPDKSLDPVTQEEIDRILDKISATGYKNLSEREKRILFEASKRL